MNILLKILVTFPYMTLKTHNLSFEGVFCVSIKQLIDTENTEVLEKLANRSNRQFLFKHVSHEMLYNSII